MGTSELNRNIEISKSIPMKEITPKSEDTEEVAKESEVDTKDPDPEISKSLTVAVKFITHRGTQTVIQCNPDVTRDDFIDIVMRTKL